MKQNRKPIELDFNFNVIWVIWFFPINCLFPYYTIGVNDAHKIILLGNLQTKNSNYKFYKFYNIKKNKNRCISFLFPITVCVDIANCQNRIEHHNHHHHHQRKILFSNNDDDDDHLHVIIDHVYFFDLPVCVFYYRNNTHR